MNYTLSTQAIAAVMMALQKSLMEQSDIVPVLQGFELQATDAGTLIVSNPPIVEAAPTPEEVIETSVQ
jgi:hypothetical protein